MDFPYKRNNSKSSLCNSQYQSYLLLILRQFSLPKQPKNLDLSYKTDLDFWGFEPCMTYLGFGDFCLKASRSILQDGTPQNI